MHNPYSPPQASIEDIQPPFHTRFKYWLEDQIDKLAPKVEVLSITKETFTEEAFENVMLRIQSQFQLIPRTISPLICVFEYIGTSIGTLSQATVLLGKAPVPEKYKNMKSRYKCTLTGGNNISISSYEHLIGLKSEREVFKEVLQSRLELLTKFIDEVA